jgi:outer membrane protein TolC
VALAFVRALHGRERLELARSIERVAQEVLRVSERRHESGDIARLDLTLAQASLARARADVRVAEAGREESLAALRGSLGLSPDEPLEIEGNLADRPVFDLPRLEGRASRRADLRALEAELSEARSDSALGAAERWPDLGLGASYERHESADIVLGTASLTLPLFERGQGLRAEADARGRRLSAELRARKNAVAVEVRAASAAYEGRVAAVQELERGALPLLDESETQVRRSYEAGQLALVDFLAVRREIVATRIEYADRLLDAAVAAVELTARAGAFDADPGREPGAGFQPDPLPGK